jgi:hypothetical protein
VILIGANGDVVLRNLSVVDGRDFFAPGISVGGKLVIDRVLVANNVGSTDTKNTGGGISVGNSGALTMVNSTVSGNLAWQGGGIYVGSGELTITSSTITGNTGGQGGGIRSIVPFLVRNSIIAGNIDANDDPYPLANCDSQFGKKPTFVGMNVSNDESCGSAEDGSRHGRRHDHVPGARHVHARRRPEPNAEDHRPLHDHRANHRVGARVLQRHIGVERDTRAAAGPLR